MIFEVIYQYTDDMGNVFSNKKTVNAVSKIEALNEYNLFAVKNSMTGVDNLDNVREFQVDIE